MADRLKGDWYRAAPIQRVCALLAEGGHRALMVGGCVRNDLLGRPVTDIDIATDATPQQVIALADTAELRTVPTGIDHGTVTVLVEGQPHEVTTFRRDVETDGRHATVAFSGEVAEDAARRDFTMNALYAEADGSVIDPLGGLPDLHARRVRFVGDPDRRLREDYLRALRFFRFHALYGDPAGGLDPEALAAIASNLDGLPRLSAERVTAELVKLLSAPDPAPAVAAMDRTGVLPVVLPGASSRLIAPLCHVESLLGLNPDPMLRLAALLPSGEAPGLRLSRAEQRRLSRYASAAASGATPAVLGYREDADIALGAVALNAAIFETVPPENARSEVTRGAAQSLPIAAADLMPGLTGSALGTALHRANEAWVASDFTLDRARLLAIAKRDA